MTLLHKLVDVLRINQRLRENRDSGAPQLIVEDLWELLQYHVTTYFDNQTSGIPPARHRSGRTLKTLTQRLKGKKEDSVVTYPESVSIFAHVRLSHQTHILE